MRQFRCETRVNSLNAILDRKLIKKSGAELMSQNELLQLQLFIDRSIKLLINRRAAAAAGAGLCGAWHKRELLVFPSVQQQL